MIHLGFVLLSDSALRRFVSAEATGTLVAGFWVLARGIRRPRFQYLTILAACSTAVFISWALEDVRAGAAFSLGISIRLTTMLAAATAVCGAVLARFLSRTDGWHQAARRAAVTTGALSLAAMVVTLATEAVLFQPGRGTPVTDPQLLVVTLVVIGQIVAMISMAMLPGYDPWGLSLKGRTLYVYAAEALLAGLFLHVYLSKPWLFHGYLQPYWPFIVMVIAFVGVGLSELFRRTDHAVLARPLERSGVFLPVLPLLGFGIVASRADYSSLFFLAALLYAILAFGRHSFVFGAVSALVGNAGLWALWHEQGIVIAQHPQFWLIPPSLSVLIAAQMNRDRLKQGQLASIRYAAVTVLYVSSTADMFLIGVGENLWLPLALCCLSVAGVLTGIVLRVQSYLYLGSAFLLLSILSMVWHAARNIGHVWPWWVFGIALGLGILALFGVFEKKRNEVLKMAERMRGWER